MAYSGNSGGGTERDLTQACAQRCLLAFLRQRPVGVVRYGCLHHRFGDRIRGAEYR